MTNLYFVDDGSGCATGWCTSKREAIRARANLAATCGSEYADTNIETHEVGNMSILVLEGLSRSVNTPPHVKSVVARERSRRTLGIRA